VLGDRVVLLGTGVLLSWIPFSSNANRASPGIVESPPSIAVSVAKSDKRKAIQVEPPCGSEIRFALLWNTSFALVAFLFAATYRLESFS
jgi:hypothetical protein